MATEEAKYAVLEKDGPFELRQYEPYIVAETLVEGDFDEVGNAGFRRLFSLSDGATGHFNRRIESIVQDLGGRKSLYSTSFFTEDEFWRIYNGIAYKKLKAKFDPQGAFQSLYQKAVLGH